MEQSIFINNQIQIKVKFTIELRLSFEGYGLYGCFRYPEANSFANLVYDKTDFLKYFYKKKSELFENI